MRLLIIAVVGLVCVLNSVTADRIYKPKYVERDDYKRKSDLSTSVSLDNQGVNYNDKDAENVRFKEYARRLGGRGYGHQENYPYYYPSHYHHNDHDSDFDERDIKIQNINDNRNENEDSVEDKNNEVGNNGNWNEELNWKKFQDITRIDEDIDIRKVRYVKKRPHHPY